MADLWILQINYQKCLAMTLVRVGGDNTANTNAQINDLFVANTNANEIRFFYCEFVD